MSYEVNAVCAICEEVDYTEARYFKYCPDCGNKVKIIAHCFECGLEGTEDKIHKHSCKCDKHNIKYKSYGGLFGNMECPICRKERLERELKCLSQAKIKSKGGLKK